MNKNKSSLDSTSETLLYYQNDSKKDIYSHYCRILWSQKNSNQMFMKIQYGNKKIIQNLFLKHSFYTKSFRFKVKSFENYA